MKNFEKKLCGKSFKGKNIANSNFQGADIRGVDFTNTILTNANFSFSICGTQNYIRICLLFVSLLLIAIAGIISEFGGDYIFIKKDYSISSDGIVLVSLLLFLFLSYFKGFIPGLCSSLTVLILALTVGLIIPDPLPMQIKDISRAWVIGFQYISLIAISFIVISLTTAVIIVILERVPIAICMVICTAMFSSFQINKSIITVVPITMIASYIGWQALVGNEKFFWIYKSAMFLASIGGTSFRNSNLTGVDFTGATLKNTDFRKAILTRTKFHQTKKLDLVRRDFTYLEKAQVRQLLVTGEGQDKNFDRIDLRGINLRGANLVDASFIGTDLSEACLQDADLSRAKLVQTQLDKTDFTGATLTGAYIEDWNITNETNFRGVKCEYVYMRFPTKKNPNPLRKPDNNAEAFADGEFGDFIQPIFDTLDLYHNQGVDPRAIAISFKELAENNPDAGLEIVAMEKRGEDKFLLRAKAAPEVDKSELSAEYFGTYNHLKSLSSSEKIQYLLTELKVKDTQITSQENQIISYENMINTALGRPSIQAETVNAEQIGSNLKNYAQKQNHKETDNSAVKTILILASNPKNTSQLRLDEEVREIDAGLQRAKKRELFDFKQRWAVRYQEVYQALLDFKPQIVHFSGHGSGNDGLFLEDENGNLKLVNTEALANLFELFSETIECVVLNACYSKIQADAIAKYIPYVIGMNQAIDDKAAIKFATGFYNALGAGESIEFAYKLGCNVIQLDGIPQHLTPALKKR